MRTLEYINEEFIGIPRPIDITRGDPIDSLIVRGCVFEKCQRGIAGWWKGPKVTHAVIEGCSFSGCEYGIKFGNAFDALTVRDCLFSDITQTAIEAGSQQLPKESFVSADLSHNDISDVHARTLAIGIWAYGVGHRVAHNVIRDIGIDATNPGEDDDAVAIYLKTCRSYCAENVLLDPGCYEGAICVKGNGCGNRIERNTIRITRPPRSARWDRAITVIANDENQITDNQIDERLRIVISTATHGNQLAGRYLLDKHTTPAGHTDAWVFWPT